MTRKLVVGITNTFMSRFYFEEYIFSTVIFEIINRSEERFQNKSNITSFKFKSTAKLISIHSKKRRANYVIYLSTTAIRGAISINAEQRSID